MAMPIPTNQDGDFWRKATDTPCQITEEERRRILRCVDWDTHVANAFKVSGLTPKQLENKALPSGGTVTEAECQLLQGG